MAVKTLIVWSAARNAHRLTRVDANTLELRSLRQGMIDQPFAQIYRGAPDAFAVGDRVQLDGASFEVTEVDGAHLMAIRVHFDTPPESGRFELVAWRKGGLARVQLPAIGESVELPFAWGPMGL